VPEIASR